MVAEGAALSETTTLPGAEVQPFTVAVTVYVPAFADVTFAIVGFCKLDVNPFGPVHE